MLEYIPKGVEFNTAETYNIIHAFVTSTSECEMAIKENKAKIQKNGMLWISWPKRSSKIQTDLNENIIRNLALENGLVDVKVCSVNDDWSGLKLVYRLKDRE